MSRLRMYAASLSHLLCNFLASYLYKGITFKLFQIEMAITKYFPPVEHSLKP
jgi:hypothetical protein